jgi:hypothetical protein
MVEWCRLIVDGAQIRVDGFSDFGIFSQKACQYWLYRKHILRGWVEIWVDESKRNGGDLGKS